MEQSGHRHQMEEYQYITVYFAEGGDCFRVVILVGKHPLCWPIVYEQITAPHRDSAKTASSKLCMRSNGFITRQRERMNGIFNR